MQLQHNPEIALWGIYPREMKLYCSHTHKKKPCTQIFTADLFVLVQNWKQLIYPSTGEQINKLWSSHITENCSVITRNELMIHAKNWMDLKGIILSGEKSHLHSIFKMKQLWRWRRDELLPGVKGDGRVGKRERRSGRKRETEGENIAEGRFL